MFHDVPVSSVFFIRYMIRSSKSLFVRWITFEWYISFKVHCLVFRRHANVTTLHVSIFCEFVSRIEHFVTRIYYLLLSLRKCCENEGPMPRAKAFSGDISHNVTLNLIWMAKTWNGFCVCVCVLVNIIIYFVNGRLNMGDDDPYLLQPFCFIHGHYLCIL